MRFDLELIRSLSDGRGEPLTRIFQLFTFLGEIEGYVLLVALVFATYDKRLAWRLAVPDAAAASTRTSTAASAIRTSASSAAR